LATWGGARSALVALAALEAAAAPAAEAAEADLAAEAAEAARDSASLPWRARLAVSSAADVFSAAPCSSSSLPLELSSPDPANAAGASQHYNPFLPPRFTWEIDWVHPTFTSLSLSLCFIQLPSELPAVPILGYVFRENDFRTALWTQS
jgi:hypothetical protein